MILLPSSFYGEKMLWNLFCNVLLITISHSTSQYRIIACDTYNISSCENGAFQLVEASVYRWFYY